MPDALAEKTCTPCRGGIPPLTQAEAERLNVQVPAWELRDTGWRVQIEGDAPLDIDIKFAKKNYDPISPGYNAHIAVNAVPAVCEATPGLRVTSDLRLYPIFA